RGVVDAVRERHGQRLGGGRVLGVAAGPGQRDDPRAGVLAHARDLGAGDERQLRLRQVLVAALVGVGVVDPRARDADEDLAVAGLGDRDVDEPEHLRAAELLHLDRAHGARTLSRGGGRGWMGAACTLTPPMSVTVVGSLAYDAVKTPFGSRDRL